MPDLRQHHTSIKILMSFKEMHDRSSSIVCRAGFAQEDPHAVAVVHVCILSYLACQVY